MLIIPKSRFDVSASRPAVLAPNHGITDSGQALVYATNGANGGAVKASAGTSGEVFAGLALTDQGYPTRLAGQITIVGTGSAATGVATLPNYIASSASVYIASSGAAAGVKVVVNSNGTVDLGGTNVLNEVYVITYSSNPLVQDLLRLFGEFPRIGALDAGAQVGCARRGNFVVTNFDTSVIWALRDTPVLGAGGTLTKGGSGTVLSNYIVTQIPSAGAPYLGLENIN